MIPRRMRERLLLLWGTVPIAVALGGCGVLDTRIDWAKAELIDRRYEERDACLKSALPARDDGRGDAVELARVMVLACKAKTERLIAAFGMDDDVGVAAAIRRDSEQRALGFLLKRRGKKPSVLPAEAEASRKPCPAAALQGEVSGERQTSC